MSQALFQSDLKSLRLRNRGKVRELRQMLADYKPEKYEPFLAETYNNLAFLYK